MKWLIVWGMAWIILAQEWPEHWFTIGLALVPPALATEFLFDKWDEFCGKQDGRGEVA